MFDEIPLRYLCLVLVHQGATGCFWVVWCVFRILSVTESQFGDWWNNATPGCRSARTHSACTLVTRTARTRLSRAQCTRAYRTHSTLVSVPYTTHEHAYHMYYVLVTGARLVLSHTKRQISWCDSVYAVANSLQAALLILLTLPYMFLWVWHYWTLI